MDRVFDRVIIAVPALGPAQDDYAAVLGCEPAASGADGALWVLPNTLIALVPRPVEAAAITGLVINREGAPAIPAPSDNILDIDLALCDGSESAALRAGANEAAVRVDHLVLRTADPEGTIALFRDELGIRLALDQTVPEWGGRMLFFRGGKMTLEVMAGDDDKDSHFWGIAYQCADIDETAAGLAARGVALSAIRDGRKPGTRVATLKSHDLGIPTLLIEPVQA